MFFYRFEKLMPLNLPSAAVAFCFPRNISVKAISRHSAVFPPHSNKTQRCEIDFEGALFLCQICVFTRFYLIHSIKAPLSLHSIYGSNLMKLQRLIHRKWEYYFRISFFTCFMKNVTHFGAFSKRHLKVNSTAFLGLLTFFLSQLQWQCQNWIKLATCAFVFNTF